MTIKIVDYTGLPEGHIYSEDNIKNPDNYLIRIKDGTVLFQKEDLGNALLEKVRSIFNAGVVWRNLQKWPVFNLPQKLHGYA